ncbi:MAG: rod shape-determining protein MreC [bacterium]|nr:rod shape-determining protein MreC [bacterium]
MHTFFIKYKLIVLLFFVSAVLILSVSSGSVRGTFTSLFSPMQSLIWKSGTTITDSFSEVSRERVQELVEENFALRGKLLSFEEMAKENERLREALGALPKKEFDLLFSEIIGKEVERDVLMLNKGAKEGVRQGMPVITQGRVAVGTIGEVFLHTAKLHLLSLKGGASDVKVQGREVVGVLRGIGRYRALLDLIPQEEELKEGDVIVTSSLGGLLPDDLLIGEVTSIEKSDLTAFQGGNVELFFQVKKENSLFILRN